MNITNGDGAAGLLKASAIDGDVLPWRDTMHEGPFPQGLDFDEVSKVRAHYLAGADLIDEDIARDFALRNEHLNAAAQYEKVILWFEHDLLDQLQILQILDWFEGSKFDIGKLSLICIDRFEGIDNFRGLGQLTPAQISTLADIAQPITEEQLKLAKAGWFAFRSSNPLDLLEFLKGDLSALPFLKATLLRHLQEYPWISDGLNRTERQLLTLIARNIDAPRELFFENMAAEEVLFMGDWTTFSHIVNLHTARVPLVTVQSGKAFMHPREIIGSRKDFAEQRLLLTDAGNRVISGALNARDVLDRDYYLGGVHIKSGQAMWMWNDKTNMLELKDD